MVYAGPDVDGSFWRLELNVKGEEPAIGLKRKAIHLAAKPGVPRSLRAKVARVRVGLRKGRSPIQAGPGLVPKSPPSPHQEGVVSSASGKVALGPWSGPFETHPEAVLPATLYMDNQGVMWTSLDAITAARRASIAAAVEQQRTGALALALATARVGHRGEDAAAARRAKGEQRISFVKNEATRGVRMRHMMRVMQPR